MLDELVSKCKDRGINEIVGYYYKSPKNSMVSDLYETLGFNLREKNDEDSVWKLDITNYKIKNKFIGVEND